jgi:Iap family predicted aminopeptidase
MRRIVLAALIAGLVGCGGSNPGPRRASDPADPMTHERALDRIARTHGGTRAAGTAGDAATADYVAARLRAAGLTVRRQPLRVTVSEIEQPARIAVGGRTIETIPLQFTGSGDVTAALHPVADHGCTSADYAELPHGSVAIARRGDCYLRVKAQRAEQAGAAALLIRAVHPISGTLVAPGIRIPVLAIGRDAPVSGRVHLSVRASTHRATTANVIGELPGGRPGRVVMAGAHLDSVPSGPGVNDDGSGVSGLLAIARRLAAHPPSGARIRFGFWGAEEIGLVGSWRYAHGLPRAERRRIRAYVNLDMIASPHPARLVYGDRAVAGVLRRHLPHAGRIDLSGSSDHASFQAVGVPAGGLFTGEQPGQDPCYHRACDTLGNVNPRALRGMTDAAEATLRDLATG